MNHCQCQISLGGGDHRAEERACMRVCARLTSRQPSAITPPLYTHTLTRTHTHGPYTLLCRIPSLPSRVARPYHPRVRPPPQLGTCSRVYNIVRTRPVYCVFSTHIYIYIYIYYVVRDDGDGTAMVWRERRKSFPSECRGQWLKNLKTIKQITRGGSTGTRLNRPPPPPQDRRDIRIDHII